MTSTFSQDPPSSPQLPVETMATRYLKCFILAVLMSAALLMALEYNIRSAGGQPSADNSIDRWARVRANVEADTNQNSIVLLGASRMQADVTLDILSQEAGDVKVHQLAEAGAFPFAALEDIAQNSEFRGLVVMSVIPGFILPGPLREEQRPLIEYYHRHWNAARHLDTWLENKVSLSFALRDQHFSALNMMRNLLKTRTLAGAPEYVVTDENREQTTMFENLPDVAPMREGRYTNMKAMMDKLDPVSPEAWVEMLQTDIAELVSLIEDRGGRVAFVYMPVSDELLKLDEDVFPKDRYWDLIARHTGADTIHFTDFESMSGFDIPDGSHLNHLDKAGYTHSLAEALRELALIN